MLTHISPSLIDKFTIDRLRDLRLIYFKCRCSAYINDHIRYFVLKCFVTSACSSQVSLFLSYEEQQRPVTCIKAYADLHAKFCYICPILNKIGFFVRV